VAVLFQSLTMKSGSKENENCEELTKGFYSRAHRSQREHMRLTWGVTTDETPTCLFLLLAFVSGAKPS